MARIPGPLRALAREVYRSMRGRDSAADAVDFDAADVDAPGKGRGQVHPRVAERLKKILKARAEFQALSDAERRTYFVTPVEWRGIKTPSRKASELRYCEGMTLEGTYHGNFSHWVFVDCDLTKARFLNSNMTSCVFFNCTQVDPNDSSVQVDFHGRLTNMANVVGLDDVIYEKLVERASERIAYHPRGTPPNRIGWRRNSARVSNLGHEHLDPEPEPTWAGNGVKLGDVKKLRVRKVLGRTKRKMSDYVAAEEREAGG